MLTASELRALEPGDLVETPHSLFPGLGREGIAMGVIETTGDSAVLMATWFGITIGRWTARLEGETVKWDVK